MSYETIIYEKKDAIGIITLHRPDKKNALSGKMHEEIISACNDIEADDNIKVMVLNGGPEIFSAGADLSEVTSELPSGPNAIERVADMEKPTVAAICGWCVAGGIELALACDFKVLSETARIGDRHIRMGLIGGAGGPTRLTRLIGPCKAMELVLTGNTIDGEEAYNVGFASRVFPQEKLMEGAMDFAGKIARNSVTALKLSKKAVKGAVDFPEYQSLHHVEQLAVELMKSAEFRARIDAFLTKKKA